MHLTPCLAATGSRIGVGSAVYAAWIAVDIIVASIGMAFRLLGVANAKRIGKALKADTSAVDALHPMACCWRWSAIWSGPGPQR
ncbi:hypothetical protein [Maricaulis sp.]|uniref:hypothetical protein n=1 Tax=Maricaulis sp. TaxID=1486257 RepID=UPI0025C4393B|nr:hypothetical protein [Maricaulis sp.]